MDLVLLTFIAACWAVIGTGAVTSVVAWSAGRGARSGELERAWAAYAAGKRFRFQPAAGDWPHVRSPRIEGRVDDVEVVIETCSMTIRGAPRPCTRIWARTPFAQPARVVVASDPRLVQGPRVHGLPSVRVLDAAFDDALTVLASSPQAAGRLLSPDLRRAVQGLLSSSYRLRLVLQVDDGDVSLTWLGEEVRPAMLDEACGVVACACGSAAAGAAYR